MGKLLDEAIREVSKLPDQEQEAIAAWLLAELASERRWNELFSSSQDVLRRLGRQAREEYRQGKTEPLDPDKL